MALPLTDVRVIELAEQGFVPSAGAVLADWGADVFKIERPGGDGLRRVMEAGLVADTGDFNFLWEQMNRNKRSLCLDLGVEGARDVLLRLVEGADVFLTNQLPQVQRKFAFEPADLHAVNPSLIYVRGHGQGARGPDAQAGGYDAVSYFARSGMAHMLAPEGGSLVMQRPAMGDGPSGAILAGAVAAALFNRERTGDGSVVDLSLLSSGLWALAPDLVATSVLGHEPAKFALDSLPTPLISPYVTGDNRYLMLNMLEGDKYWDACCRALHLDDLADDESLVDDAARRERIDGLRERFKQAIGSRPLPYWTQRLADAGCVFSMMASPTEVLTDPQVEANGYMPRHPTHPTARLVASPHQFDEKPAEVRRRAPELGEHTVEILAQFGLSADEIEAATGRGAVVQGATP